jgi:hypothetical protein
MKGFSAKKGGLKQYKKDKKSRIEYKDKNGVVRDRREGLLQRQKKDKVCINVYRLV